MKLLAQLFVPLLSSLQKLLIWSQLWGRMILTRCLDFRAQGAPKVREEPVVPVAQKFLCSLQLEPSAGRPSCQSSAQARGGDPLAVHVPWFRIATWSPEGRDLASAAHAFLLEQQLWGVGSCCGVALEPDCFLTGHLAPAPPGLETFSV